jgi:hypothetical protein
VEVYISIDGDSYDWFDGPCEFPVLPPIGSTLRIIDRNANMQELNVKNIVVKGARAAMRKELPSIYGDLPITLVCVHVL